MNIYRETHKPHFRALNRRAQRDFKWILWVIALAGVAWLNIHLFAQGVAR